MGNDIILLQLLNTTKKLLNRAHIDRCKKAQKPRIKNLKTSNRRQRRCQPTIRFSSSLVALNHNFFHNNSELVLPPYEATEILLWALRAQIIKSEVRAKFMEKF